MPSIRQLKYVIKIVEFGSINEAAKHLFVTQPSLSNALKSIEEELNIEIFQRTSQGVKLTEDGSEFLSYARQIIEQVELLESKYTKKKQSRRMLSISCQHYAFAVHAFAELIKNYSQAEYEFTLRETQTYNILEDLTNFRSELGIIYLNNFNQKVLHKVLRDKHLEFTPLFKANPHVFMGVNHPLADKKRLTLEELSPYPYLSFEQGEINSFYYAEEILSTRYTAQNIKVSDRATIFNLILGVNGYTISSGIISRELNDEKIISIPLDVEDYMVIGVIKHKQVDYSKLAVEYLAYLKQHIKDYEFDIISD